MARIRSIKPEFWDDRALAKTVSRDARLLYIALWNQADEWGRVQGDPSWIKGRAFPYDDDLSAESVIDLLGELEGQWVEVYTVAGDPYLYLPKLAKHQRLEPEKVPSRLPDPPSLSGAQVGADESARGADENALKQGAGGRLQGAGGRASATPPEPFCDEHPKGTRSSCRACADARRARAAWDEAQKTAPTPQPPKARELREKCAREGHLPDGHGFCTRCEAAA